MMAVTLISATVTASAAVDRLKATDFDRNGLGARNLPYERLDQLTFDILMGVR